MYECIAPSFWCLRDLHLSTMQAPSMDAAGASWMHITCAQQPVRVLHSPQTNLAPARRVKIKIQWNKSSTLESICIAGALLTFNHIGRAHHCDKTTNSRSSAICNLATSGGVQWKGLLPADPYQDGSFTPYNSQLTNHSPPQSFCQCTNIHINHATSGYHTNTLRTCGSGSFS